MSETKNPDNPSSGPSRAGNVTYLDQALWRQLVETEELDIFLNAWLELQTKMVYGISQGIIILGEPDKGPYSIAAVWPRGDNEIEGLSEVVQRVLETRKGVATRDGAGEELDQGASLQLGYPIKVKGTVAGAAAFKMGTRSRDQLQSVMRQIQWGLAWIENWLLCNRAIDPNGHHSKVSSVLDLTAVTVQEKNFKASANTLVTELAARMDCDRVSLGIMKDKNVKVVALSHAAQFKKQMNLVRAIGAAMAESLDQGEAIVYPAREKGKDLAVKMAHGELASLTGDGAVCTIPIMDDRGKGSGALTLERSPKKPFTNEEVELLDTLISLAGPILEGKRLNERWFTTRLADLVKTNLQKVFGPGHLVLKAVSASVLAVIVFLSLAIGTYRVTAKTTIEGAVQRAVVAPYDGFLFDAPVRAGDTVEEGQVLCSLDDRDMKIEKVRWSSQREQLLRQYREAMAEGNRANVNILREQINQAEAQINLLDEQLARTKMVAPFDGIVITGDLSQALGSPVQRGQVLFELAPLEDYRLILRVDEREIDRLEPGQKGTLILNALPEEPFSMTVKKITPVSAAEEGHNFFVVEGALDESFPNLRPGMEGYSKVKVDRRRLIWIWTHDIYDWLRLWLWSWWP